MRAPPLKKKKKKKKKFSTSGGVGPLCDSLHKMLTKVIAGKPLKGMYQAHEKEKKTKYLHRVIEVEKSSFTPFVISTTGGMAPEADAFLKRLSQKLSTKLDQSYSNTVGYLRRKLRIELLKTVLMSVRGFRKSKTVNISDLDLNLLSYYVK